MSASLCLCKMSPTLDASPIPGRETLLKIRGPSTSGVSLMCSPVSLCVSGPAWNTAPGWPLAAHPSPSLLPAPLGTLCPGPSDSLTSVPRGAEEPQKPGPHSLGLWHTIPHESLCSWGPSHGSPLPHLQTRERPTLHLHWGAAPPAPQGWLAPGGLRR